VFRKVFGITPKQYVRQRQIAARGFQIGGDAIMSEIYFLLSDISSL
jgi:AraC-like DNA-binding protein